MLHYREAIAAHADGIASLIRTTWDMPADAAWIRDIIAKPEHIIWVAVDVQPDTSERVIGFCAGFWTTAHDGATRWEMDLLAVHPDERGKGIGRALVAQCSLAGERRATAFQRALIAVGNTTSERSFASNGFAPITTCELWVGSPATSAADAPTPVGTHLIPVDTLTYRGVWVEQATDAAALRAAQQIALADGRDTVGAVIPVGTPHDAEALGFSLIDTYQWWVKSEEKK